MDALPLLLLCASGYMTGIIWFVQLIAYPMAEGGAKHMEYTRRMTWVVAPVMVAEMGLQVAWLVLDPTRASIASAIMLAGIWGLTFLRLVPLHAQLEQGHDKAIVRKLVLHNWPRTFLWTGRTVLLAIVLAA